MHEEANAKARSWGNVSTRVENVHSSDWAIERSPETHGSGSPADSDSAFRAISSSFRVPSTVAACQREARLLRRYQQAVVGPIA